MNTPYPVVTCIIPCYNERLFIGQLVETLVNQDYPSDRLEVLVVDGGSTDGTREIIVELEGKYPVVRCISNPERYVPFALNRGIKAAKGEVIAIIGAHSSYPPDYLSVLVTHLIELNADNVGAFLVTEPGDDSDMALAIAKVLSSPFGIGNAMYRTGNREVCRTDTVPFGCYRRDVFDRFGLFDESLLRNQDYEFNLRLVKGGGSIYLVPSVTVRYFTRSSSRQLFRMHYQYGLYNPLVALRAGRPILTRHLVPLVFLLFLVFGSIGALFSHYIAWLLVAGAGTYLACDLFYTIRLMLETKRMILLILLPWLFLILHLSYGYGYLVGILRFLVFGRNMDAISTTR